MILLGWTIFDFLYLLNYKIYVSQDFSVSLSSLAIIVILVIVISQRLLFWVFSQLIFLFFSKSVFRLRIFFPFPPLEDVSWHHRFQKFFLLRKNCSLFILKFYFFLNSLGNYYHELVLIVYDLFVWNLFHTCNWLNTSLLLYSCPIFYSPII